MQLKAPRMKISSHSQASALWLKYQEGLKKYILKKIGVSREIMGIHYPSDEEAARQLAHGMLSLMWNTDKFQNDFAKAKEEWN